MAQPPITITDHADLSAESFVKGVPYTGNNSFTWSVSDPTILSPVPNGAACHIDHGNPGTATVTVVDAFGNTDSIDITVAAPGPAVPDSVAIVVVDAV